MGSLQGKVALVSGVGQGVGRAEAFTVDVADTAAVPPLVEQVVRRPGGVDILVNNAYTGGGVGRDGIRANSIAPHALPRGWRRGRGPLRRRPPRSASPSRSGASETARRTSDARSSRSPVRTCAI